MITLEELKQRLVFAFDEITILELLDISREELVEAFADKIEEKFDTLVTELGEEEWETEQD